VLPCQLLERFKRIAFCSEEQLLADIQVIFAQKGVDRLPSGDLAAVLAQLEGRPWAEWGRTGKPITPNALARQLKRFAIAPDDIWTGDRNLKGYLLSQFADVFTRYLGSEGVSQPRNREEPTAMGTSTTFATARTGCHLAVGKCEKPNNDGHSRGCAVGNRGMAGNGHAEAADHRCDHCGQFGATGLWDWPGRPSGIWLHSRCESAWADSSGRSVA
jgi:hypothetical protein